MHDENNPLLEKSFAKAYEMQQGFKQTCQS